MDKIDIKFFNEFFNVPLSKLFKLGWLIPLDTTTKINNIKE